MHFKQALNFAIFRSGWQNINKEVDVYFVYFMILTLEALIKHCETAIISQCLLSHF